MRYIVNTDCKTKSGKHEFLSLENLLKVQFIAKIIRFSEKYSKKGLKMQNQHSTFESYHIAIK